MNTHQPKQSLQWIGLACRILFGATFIFSGFVKAIDPLGFSYKMQDYLAAWNLTQFNDLTLFGSVCMSAVEFLIGCCVLFGVQLKLAAWCGLAFMVFYTPLTLWIALTNPVSDCGCFGEAIIITNWQTFWKNLVLLALVIVILLTAKYNRCKLSPLPSWLLVATCFAISVTISCFCLKYLPIIDFRPYKIGANIAENMAIPDGAPRDKYETTFIYEKNGVEQEFTLNNYPWQDTTWHFVDQHSVLVEQGYTPPIHDFSVATMDDDDITDDVLAYTGDTYLVVMYDLSKTDTAHLADIIELCQRATATGARVYTLTGTYKDDALHFAEQHAWPFTFCATDPIQLKTMVRANPGVVVLRNGTVIDKFSHNSVKKRLQQQ
ncbi:MAG: BT_3928 family protein [Paludibacteraceae bacterium]